MRSNGSFRFVDAHVHQWDVTKHMWYPAMQSDSTDKEHEAGLGDVLGGIPRVYLREQYEQDSSAFDVTKIIHIAAGTTPAHYLDEARWIAGMMEDGWPAAALGTFDPALPITEIERSIAQQVALPGFRGVRGWFGLDPTTPKTRDIFGLAAGTDWLFDLVIRPAEAHLYAPLIQAADSTVFVLEHAGWPETPDADHRKVWKEAIEILAESPNLHCKISGLPMTLHTVEASALRPYVEVCIEAFGVERCLVGSNFPVDSLFGSYSDLINSYREIITGLGDSAVEQLFVTNAERLYRI